MATVTKVCSSSAQGSTPLGAQPWANLGNLYAADGTFASWSATGINMPWQAFDLWVWGFGFAIPADQAITKLSVVVRGCDTYGGSSHAYLPYLAWWADAVTPGTPTKVFPGAATFTTTNTDYQLDITDPASLPTVAQLNASSFGVQIPSQWSSMFNESNTIQVDSVSLIAEYATAGYPNNVCGVPAANIASINGVPTANIAKVLGV